MDSVRQTFGDLVTHTPHRTFRWHLPWTFSTFDYRELCALLKAQSPDVPFDTAKVEGITRARDVHTVHTDRGDLRAPLVIDALGWRRVLSVDARRPDPAAGGAAVARAGGPPALALGGPRALARPPLRARGLLVELPRRRRGARRRRARSTRTTRSRSRRSSWPNELGVEAVRYQGNWIPHRIRPAAEGDVFFAGDSAGHCLPTTAEGIRTALYFGLACGRELRAVRRGPAERGRRRWSATARSRSRTAGSSRRCGTCSRCSASSTARPARRR